jgi:prepilin-type N-terminal cleavage/methylation domain-containing protein
MKKNGFTLAEVLITLAIIGVVATMTLPALMTNTSEQQYKSAMKKAVNTLTEAAQMHNSIDGYSFSGFQTSADIVDETADATFSMEALLRMRTSIDFTKTGNSKFDVKGAGTGAADQAISADEFVHFRDGSVLLYKKSDTIASNTNAKMEDDGLPTGYVVAIDTNGMKGPNQLSNCQGNALGQKESQNPTASVDYTGTCTKAKRVIKDQFLLRLRGTTVQPEGEAANWAFNN